MRKPSFNIIDEILRGCILCFSKSFILIILNSKGSGNHLQISRNYFLEIELQQNRHILINATKYHN